MLTNRRQKDKENALNNIIRSSAKATVAFVFFGLLSFIGSWGVSLSTGVAKLREDVAVIHERQEFIGPWFMDSIKEIKEDFKEMKQEIKKLGKP